MAQHALERHPPAVIVLIALATVLLTATPTAAIEPANDAGASPRSDVSPQARAILDTLKPNPEDLARDYPAYFNWADLGGVTPLKDQGTCESCWAFAAYADIESGILRTEGITLNLAEQQPNDCNHYGSNCDTGGWLDGAYQLAMSPGAVGEVCMPYLDNDGQCTQRFCDKIAFVDGWEYIAGDVNSYKAAIMEGPIPACDGIHCILIVGWNDASQNWICKDSLGAMWSYYSFTSGMTYGTSRAVNPHTPVARLVPDEFATIQEAIDASERGDVIKVAGGAYTGSVALSSMRYLYGGYDPTFTIRDPEIYPTVIDVQGAPNGIVSGSAMGGSEGAVIDGFEIMNASAEGILMWTGDDAAIRNTVVRGCTNGIRVEEGAYSISYADHSLRIEDCTIRDNAGTGIQVIDVAEASVGVYWCAVYGNTGSGIISDSAPTYVENCTITANDVDGIDFTGSTGNAVLSSIVAENGRYGVAASGPSVTITCTDVWGNDTADLVGCALGAGSISEDPLFCDSPTSDFTLYASSPCRGTGDYGQDMGALGVACPAGPLNVAVAQDGAALLLSWSPPPGGFEVDHYVVYRDTLWMGMEPVAVVAAPETTFTDTTIPPCAMHDYCVTAVDSSGFDGAPSDEVSGELCYGGPQDLEVAFDEGGNELVWSVADGPVDSYMIMRSTETVPPDSIGSVPASETEYVDTDIADCVRNNRTYEIVPVYDTTWRGASSEPVTIDPKPSAPANVSAEWSVDDIILTWSVNCEDDFRRYWVYRDTIPFSDPIDSERLVAFTPDTTHIDMDMNHSATWFYRLAGTDASSQASVYSEMVWLGTGQRLEVPSPYATIQAAIDAAAAIDTVWVSPGTYDENITLKDGVLVMSSDGAASTTIRSSSGTVVSGTGLGDLTLLEGFTVDGQGTASSGLTVTWSAMRVTDCVFQNCSDGASFNTGASPTMSGNTFTLCSNGATVADSSAPFFSGCTFSDNSLAGINNSSNPGPEVGRTLADANDFENNAYFHILNMDAAAVDADYNYWGDVCVEEGWFLGPVDYIPWTDAAHENTFTECPNSVPGDEVPERAFSSYNFPNPFNPTTTIRYAIPAPGGRVSLSIYDLSGRRVKTLINTDVAPGTYTATWRGLDDSGRQLGSGVYFYRLEAGGRTLTKKMVLLK